MIILTEGNTNPVAAKTATSVIRYRREEVVAILDSQQQGGTSQELLGLGGDLPIIGQLDQCPDANTLLIGIAPAGGRFPNAWRLIIIEAIERGLNIVSGLHDFLSDDAQLSRVAKVNRVTLTDVRKNDQRRVASREGIREDCLRIHTVGADCGVGKMVTAIEINEGLKSRGHDAKFVATGQTGIMIEGDGCPIDCVVADFVNGAAEKLILDRQDHDILLVEGQGSLVHPRYSAVTLGLLHGCMPQGMILCYEVGRTAVHGMEQVSLLSLEKLVEIYEMMASAMHPSQIIGISMNSRRVSDAEATAERERVRKRLGLPVCDIFRHGPDDLIDAVLRLQIELFA